MGKYLVLKAKEFDRADMFTTELVEVEFDSDKIELQTLQKEVEGLIEIFYHNEQFIKEKIDMFCNEEGKLESLIPVMALAEQSEKDVAGTSVRLIDLVVGNVVFCSQDRNGYSIGLSEKQIKLVQSVFGKNRDWLCVSAKIKGDRKVDCILPLLRR